MNLVDPLLKKGYFLTTDNFYSSPELGYELIKKTDMYGTVKKGREGLPVIFKELKLKRVRKFHSPRENSWH